MKDTTTEMDIFMALFGLAILIGMVWALGYVLYSGLRSMS